MTAIRALALAALAAGAAPPAVAQSGYAGAGACRGCHPAQFESQSSSGHARTLHRVSAHPLFLRFGPSGPMARAPRYRFALDREPGQLRVRASDGETEMEIPVEWAFGSGTHGVSFVSRMAEDAYLEHAFSYYADAGTFDLTPGHRSLPTTSLREAVGQWFRSSGGGFTIQSCFQCHSTGPVTVQTSREIGIGEAGVRCEACHGPSRGHIDAAMKGDLASARQAVRHSRSLTAEDLNRLCGTCHRSPEGGVAANDFTNPWNVRHQPPYLEQSRCFGKSAGALSCLTCHAPHEPLRRNDPAYYRARCAGCHTPGGAHPPAKTCNAAAASDCTGCHMPAVSADPHLRFRNHWIGVYREGAPLMPSR